MIFHPLKGNYIPEIEDIISTDLPMYSSKKHKKELAHDHINYALEEMRLHIK
jgi:hypothetical protein